jgi:tRNA(fMet)-specific endonuclease VapC
MKQMTPMLVDTDTLSAIMRRRPAAMAKARDYLALYNQFTFSIITRYEILRGLKAKGANKQEAAFERLCISSNIIGLTDAIVVKAAGIYAELHRQGTLIGDADILIAASALVNGCGVATNNEKHFQRVSGLHIENWLK